MARRSARTFSSALAPFVLTVVGAKGGDAERLRSKYLSGGEPGQLPVLTIDEFRGLMEEAAREARDPLFGLHCAFAMSRGAYGLLEFALRSASTGREMLEQLVEFGDLINPAVQFSLEVSGNEVALHHRVPDSSDGAGRHGNYFTVSRLAILAREMISETLLPTRAWFAHREKVCPPELVKAIGSDRVTFGRTSNGLAFDAQALETAVPTADPELNAVLRQHATALLQRVQEEGIYQRTRSAVLALLPSGDVSLARVAKRLHLSDRTLQRRLTDEGVAFAQLVNEVRTQLAQQLLTDTNQALPAIAERLGYKEASTFLRAFKRWTGKTPGSYRAEAGR